MTRFAGLAVLVSLLSQSAVLPCSHGCHAKDTTPDTAHACHAAPEATSETSDTAAVAPMPMSCGHDHGEQPPAIAGIERHDGERSPASVVVTGTPGSLDIHAAPMSAGRLARTSHSTAPPILRSDLPLRV